jgi:putative PIN family toxin of toxin-antitoxin system
MRLVLDSNVWLDWLVFDDPAIAPIRAAVAAGYAQVFIDDACEAELRRVLSYKFNRKILEEAQQQACIARCLAVARRIDCAASELQKKNLPRCSDADDQKFLEAATAAHADYLVTKDAALLALSRRGLPFRIVKPGGVVLE